MIPNQTLINAFRAVANEIEKSDSEWNWGYPDSCNCGLLARELGVEREDINIEVLSDWSKYFDKKTKIEKVCLKTRLPITKVFGTLRKYGITNEDIKELEYVGMNVEGSHSQAVINYCLNKANELEQQLININYSKKKEQVEQKVSII